MAGLFSRFFGGSVQTATGVAIGEAVAPTLLPYAQALANDAWESMPDRPPSAVLLASGVAQGQVDPVDAAKWALQQGYDGRAFKAMVEIANVGPGVAEALELWRRDLLDADGFFRALQRAGLEEEFQTALAGLRRRLLAPDELANAVVQGFRTQGDAAADALLQGYDAADFGTMVDVTGLPPGPETLLDWLRRGIIDQAQLEQGIREGHTKIKYIPFYEAARSHVLSATNYVNAAIRGWITPAEMTTGGALTGYDAAAMDLLFKIHGRPATTHQVHIGYARGGRNADIGDDERATFRRAVLESDIRPEWEPILWAQRYSYPAAFVLRALTTSGDLTEAQTHEILLFEGWEPTLAATVSAQWAAKAGATGAADPHIVKAQTHLWNALHKSYVARESGAGEVQPGLTSIGVPAASQAAVLALWDAERALIHAELTPTQIRKAVAGGITNPATGQPWTHADALAALLARGYSQADAEVFLAE